MLSEITEKKKIIIVKLKKNPKIELLNEQYYMLRSWVEIIQFRKVGKIDLSSQIEEKLSSKDTSTQIKRFINLSAGGLMLNKYSKGNSDTFQYNYGEIKNATIHREIIVYFVHIDNVIILRFHCGQGDFVKEFYKNLVI